MKKRLVFVDLLRGWALLVMIEVHVFNAFLLPELRETGWFDVLNFINGMVAPSFLFVSGFVFVLGSERKLEEYRSFGRAFWRQIGRIGMIWAIGYGLHIPFFSFVKTVHETTETGWLKFFQVDILHCIAVGLVILLISRIVIRSEKAYRGFIWVGTIAIAVVSPFIWDIDFNRYLPSWLAAYLNGQHYSIFPIFPWIAFMLAGGIAAMQFLQMRAEEKLNSYLPSVIKAGIILLFAGLIIPLLSIQIPFASTSTRASPFFFTLRVGLVFLLLAICYYYEEYRHTEQSFVLDASRESLLVYAGHLLIIYGTFWNDRGLVDIFGKSFGVIECVAATIVLAALMILAANGWGWIRRRSVVTSRRLALATGAIVIVLFFMKG